MTGKGMMMTLADGTQTIVNTADKVVLITGHTGTVHRWAGDGKVMVTLDHPIRIPIGFPPIAAFDCEGKHIAKIMPKNDLGRSVDFRNPLAS